MRFKAATKQTKAPGGKSKSAKPSDNRSAQTKGYLKKGQGGGGRGADGGLEGKTDRFEVIRQILYEADPQTSETARLVKLEKLLPEAEIHETIHRAWQLRLRHQRDYKTDRLERRYRAVNNALEELRLANRRLYLKTIKDEHGSFHRLQNILQPSSDGFHINSTGKLVGLFPRQMRIPTEYPPDSGKMWDHAWKNPVDPLANS